MKNSTPAITDYQNAILLLLKEKLPSFILGFIIASYLSFLIVINMGIKWQTAKVRNTQDTHNSKLGLIKTYTVQLNDDLWGIAEKMYGSGFNAIDIAQANKLSEPYTLIENQILIIPSLSPKKPTQGEVTQEAAQTKNITEYVVLPGDYLWLIAEKVYGDGNQMDKLIEVNNIPYPYNVEEGQVLLIP